MTAWPSGLRRQLKALVRKGVGSNPTAVIYCIMFFFVFAGATFRVFLRKHNQGHPAVIAQLGERQTEDLEVLGSIPSPGTVFVILLFFFLFEFFERNFFGAPVART